MSCATDLIISYPDDNPAHDDIVRVEMDKASAAALFEYMFDHYDNIAPGCKDQLHGDYWSYFFSVCDIPEQYTPLCAH